MEAKEKPQHINIAMDHAKCTGCGRNILDIGNIKFVRNASSGAKYREEVYVCRECGTEFILRYDLFDDKGHIHQRVFSGDPNDPKYNWPDILDQEQKQEIAKHLKDCPVCNERLTKEIELDVWFANVLHNKE